MYCPGTDQAIPCPYAGKTFHVGSTVRLDCHCPRSYYRNPPNDLLSFNCSLCTPNDYCFNNSLFNCTDPLMISDAGSGYFKNCTCIDRFYNDGEVCTQCSVDHYCVDGKEYACPENEWTNSLPRQAECVCQQGYYRHEGVCIMCPENFYCDGTDDLSRLCPQFSIAENYTSDISQCLCPLVPVGYLKGDRALDCRPEARFLTWTTWLRHPREGQRTIEPRRPRVLPHS